jgi:dihydrofolate reductase
VAGLMSAPLIYFSTVSLDNYREDSDGRFDWSTPDEEVHTFINELFRPTRLHLYGRRNYETMMFWDEDHPELSGASRGWAELWNDVDKVIYSTTLGESRMRRSILRSRFDADEVARWKAESAAPIAIGGGELASEAARLGLLDEVHLIVTPVLLGGGTPYLAHGIRRHLELLDEHRFASGSVYLRYRLT